MTFSKLRIGDLCSVRIGRTPRRDSPQFWGGSAIWVTVRELSGGVITSSKEQISDLAVREVMQAPIPVGTLLFSFKLSIGKMAIAGAPLYTNEAIAALVILDPNQLDRDYLRFALMATSSESSANHAVLGKVLNKEKVEGIEIPVPPLPEQRRIVDLLSRAEGIVRLRREAEKKSAELIPALFLDMFGDPVTNPKGWEIKALSETGAAIRYGIGQPLPQKADGLPFLRATNVKRGKISRTGLVFIDAEANPMKRNPPLDRSDIIVVRSGAYTGDVAQVGAEYEGSIAGYDLVLRPSAESHLSEFVANYLLLPHVQDNLIGGNKIRAAQPHLNAKQLGGIPTPCPPMAIQQKFVASVAEVGSIQNQQSTATTKAQAVFDALLTQVFA